jgi:hypothetical protein
MPIIFVFFFLEMLISLTFARQESVISEIWILRLQDSWGPGMSPPQAATCTRRGIVPSSGIQRLSGRIHFMPWIALATVIDFVWLCSQIGTCRQI